MEQLQAPIIIWQLASDSAMALQVGITREEIAKHGQGKFAQLARYSPDSLIEYLLELGMRSTLTAIEADRERRNKDAFTSEMSRLESPNPGNLDELIAYAAKCKALRSKYGIGGDKQKV
jgi:hypothetical protein